MSQINRYRQTARHTDRHTDWLTNTTDRQTDRQTQSETNRLTYRQVDTQTDRQTGWTTERQMDIQRDRHKDIQRERQNDGQTDSHRNRERHVVDRLIVRQTDRQTDWGAYVCFCKSCHILRMSASVTSKNSSGISSSTMQSKMLQMTASNNTLTATVHLTLYTHD